ncbi:hypothetical protein LPB142_16565 [Rhodobacter xanthinilyticus]|uniref:Uncharacterized protein n=1 Tax=Rhodobacter xanthinilyticus TaxID=1850250 RepID=A0A1D9MFT9_9RHOB|nr:hypothetical protein [Rhodobacter xanthinilyticus]AOZ70744.1 hypothetical protein LPB142_16565 [Rhodobacter xanthinilyticus]
MPATIHQSTKFAFAREQYFAVAHGHTLLRLTLGACGGQPGGAIKTATASDFGAAPVFRDREALTKAMRRGVQNLGGRAQDVNIEIDGKGRRFGEIALAGSREQLIEALRLLAEQMEDHLGRSFDSAHDSGYSDLRELYHDLHHTEGEPVYLSDGVYLGSDGRLFE